VQTNPAVEAVSTVVALTTVSGSLFQCRTTRWLKKFLLSSDLLLLVQSFNSWPVLLWRFLSGVKKQFGLLLIYSLWSKLASST